MWSMILPRSPLLRSVVGVAVVLACAAWLGSGAASRSTTAPATMIVFAVEWPHGLTPPGPQDVTYEVCGVVPGGRSYRLTEGDIGTLSTQGALSPDGTRLAYAPRGSFDSGVRLIELPATPLPGGVDHADSPSWSPDGQQLVFVSPPGGGSPQNIWAARPDGSARRQLTTGSVRDADPRWSPDGSTIAFDSNRNGHSQLYEIAADGSGLRNVSHSTSNDRDPDWSPDGKSLVFVSGRSLELIGADGTGRRSLGIDGVWPAWSPDGRQIAYVRDGSLHVVGADGKGDDVVYRLDVLDDFAIGWGRIADPARLAVLPPCLLRLAPGRHRLAGSSSGDALYGGSGADVLLGGAGSDLIWGYGGNDRIAGGSGPDAIDAGAGNDIVYGGPGSDYILGGSGNDVIYARDGARDQIICGTGRDRVVADRVDRVAHDCERVTRG